MRSLEDARAITGERVVGATGASERSVPGALAYMEAKPMRKMPLSDVAAEVVPEAFPGSKLAVLY